MTRLNTKINEEVFIARPLFFCVLFGLLFLCAVFWVVGFIKETKM